MLVFFPDSDYIQTMKLENQNWPAFNRSRSSVALNCASTCRRSLSGFRFQVPGFKFAVFLAVVFLAGVSSSFAATANNPYQEIVTRNVFGLVPIPTNTGPVNPVPPPNLPKITPNGLMTIFGKLQVLFKVIEPGKAGKEDAYVMGEGDRQDDIAVQNIDEKTATITFNNHGTIQTLPLVDGKASGGAATTGGGGGVPGLPQLAGQPASSGAAMPANFGSHFGQRPGRAGQVADAGSAGLGGANSGGANGQNQPPPLTPEEQVIMIEANRLVTQKQVENGEMPPLPPTEMTPPDATGIGGAPLEVPPPGNPNGKDSGSNRGQ